MKKIHGVLIFLLIAGLNISAQNNYLIVIDKSIYKYEAIIDCLSIDAEVLLLDEDGNQLKILTEKLSDFENLDAMYLFTCGKDGLIFFNDAQITTESIHENAKLLNKWHLSFNDKADLMIYTCNLANTNEGRGLIRRLSAQTGLDVAASINDTGNENTGCDWDLEFRIGNIEANDCLDKKSIAAKYPGKFGRIN